jgi:O-antigen ligase
MRRADVQASGSGNEGSNLVFGGLWGLLWVTTFLVAGPWAGFHAILLGCLGLLVWLRPSQVPLPAVWWSLALAFVLAGAAAFLPARWFHVPEWRTQLESLGVATGPMVAIQSRQAVESLALFAVTLFAGLWLAGHRPTAAQVRLWALMFTLGVACYAVIAKLAQDSPHLSGTFGAPQFGFFPNRNHSATYLAMGAVCGLGCVLQALRDKRFGVLALALAATALCLWAIAAWSISRAGIVLVAIGCLLWLSMLGRRYLGRHGLWAIALIAITAVGLFFTAETGVRERLSLTVEKAGAAIGAEPLAESVKDKPALAAGESLDFRIPVFRDALALIAKFPWTGIGAGQFFYIIPQYRHHTIVANDSDCYHPESDWLWMAAETGVPATLALLALVVLAAWKSFRGIRLGRDRALRAACLVAAMLVPIHGFFDVPGHRITLALSALFLFVLSLHPPSSEIPLTTPRRWPSRSLGLCLLAISVVLMRAQWFGGRQPALTAAAHALAQVKQLHREDQALQQAAQAEGREHQPDPAEDKLEQALAILDAAKAHAPLTRDLYRHEAYFALHFDDKYDRVDRAFAIDRVFDPAWVAGPLRQAEAWADADPSRAVPLFREAIRRASAVEQLDPENRWKPATVRDAIRQLAGRYPGFKNLSGTIDLSD